MGHLDLWHALLRWGPLLMILLGFWACHISIYLLSYIWLTCVWYFGQVRMKGPTCIQSRPIVEALLFPIKIPSTIYEVLEFWSCWFSIPIRLGFNFNQAGTNSVMTHVMILSAKVSRNERLWHTIDIGSMFEPTFGFKFHNHFKLKNKITKKFVVLLISMLLHGTNLHCLILLQIWHLIS